MMEQKRGQTFLKGRQIVLSCWNCKNDLNYNNSYTSLNFVHIDVNHNCLYLYAIVNISYLLAGHSLDSAVLCQIPLLIPFLSYLKFDLTWHAESVLD